jgi:hypothetical protein
MPDANPLCAIYAAVPGCHPSLPKEPPSLQKIGSATINTSYLDSANPLVSFRVTEETINHKMLPVIYYNTNLPISPIYLGRNREDWLRHPLDCYYPLSTIHTHDENAST